MKIQKLGSKTLSYIKYIRIAVLSLGTAILFYACEKSNLEEIKAFSSPENLPVLEAENFETLYTDSGTVRFSLKTPKLLRYENDGTVYTEFPQGMQLVRFDENQEIISSITSDYAKQFIKEAKWEAKNNVIVTNAKGDTLMTEHLIWEEKSGKIYTDEFVRIIGEKRTLTGDGLTSREDMKDWKIKNPKGIVYVEVKEKSQPGDIGDEMAEPRKKGKKEAQTGTTLKFK